MSHRFDKRALPLADRHYSRQKPGTPQFVRNGSCVVLLTPDADALWVSTWQQFIKHKWCGVWECSLFRNESPLLSSMLIREAMAATLFVWGRPPPRGFLTTVDAGKVKHKRDPGRCFLKAGFVRDGETTSGKLVFICPVESLPEPEQPMGYTGMMLGDFCKDRSFQSVSRNVKNNTAQGGEGKPE